MHDESTQVSRGDANRSHLIERIPQIEFPQPNRLGANNVCGNDPVARNNPMISIRLSRQGTFLPFSQPSIDSPPAVVANTPRELPCSLVHRNNPREFDNTAIYPPRRS